MLGKDIPVEDDRLASISAYRILDTPAEKGFDDIVTLATLLCSTPVALVSLVDRNRQWFKARVGFEPCETDLDSSVCRHALGMTDILEIEDLTKDSWTESNPLVTGEPFIRFYAGAPLTDGDGNTLGTLCVIDKVPRPGGLTDAQRTGLRALANQVMAQLDLRRSLADRDASQKVALAEAARLEAMIATQQAVAAASADIDAVFRIIVDGALNTVDAAQGAVIEIRNGDDLVYSSVSGTSSPHAGLRLPMDGTLSGHVMRDERPRVSKDAEADPRVDPAIAKRLGIRSMVVVPVTRRGEVVGALKVQSSVPEAFSPRDVVMTQMLAGLAASAFGDVAEARSSKALRDAEVRYRQTFESATEFAVIVTGQDGLITDWNTGAERIFGWTADEMRGNDVSRFFTPEDLAIHQPEREMKQALIQGRGSDERWHLRKDGSRFYASGDMMPLVGDDGEHRGFVKILRDRTPQKLAESALEASERRYRILYDAIDEGFCILEMRFDESGAPTDYRFLEVNPSFERQTGLHDAVGRWMKNLAPAHEQHWFDIYGRIAKSGKPERFEQHAQALGDRWFEVYAYPVGELHSGQVAVLFNDVSERKRAAADLVASERKWRGLFENLHEGFILGKVIRDAEGRIVDWRYEEVNRAWGELVGIASSQAAGRTIRELFPGIEDAWVTEFADVVDTNQPISFTRQVGGLDRWYDGVCQPAGDDRFTVLFIEVTDRVQAERRREALRELGDALLVAEDPDAIPNVAAKLVGNALEVGRVGYGSVADDGETFTVPVDWTAEGYPSLAGTYRMSDYGGYAQDLRDGRTVVIPDIRLDPRTSADTAPLESVAVRTLVNHPIVEKGRTVAILYVNDDRPRNWTPAEIAFVSDAADRTRTALERRRAELAVRLSEERQRLAIAVGEIGVWELDLASGVLSLDARMRGMNGVSGDELDAAGAFAAVHPDDRERLETELDRLASGAIETLSIQYRVIGIEDGIVRTVLVNGMADRDSNGKATRLLGAARDVTDRVAAEEQRAVLNAELAHRMKNTLATVQAIATQTLRSSPDIAAARKALGERITAMSKAHDILLVGRRDAGDIESIVASAVAAHDPNGRVRLAGPYVQIGSKAALTLSLIVHELATNALKYGALSSDTGRVNVSWSVEADGDRERSALSFEWKESGGPVVTPPLRKSFGTRLIEMGLSGSAASSSELFYAPDGLRCRLTASLDELKKDEPHVP